MAWSLVAKFSVTTSLINIARYIIVGTVTVAITVTTTMAVVVTPAASVVMKSATTVTSSFHFRVDFSESKLCRVVIAYTKLRGC